MTTPCTPIPIFHGGGPSGPSGPPAGAAHMASSLIHAPHPSTISTASSLSHALAPVAPPGCAWIDPELVAAPLAPVAPGDGIPDAPPASPAAPSAPPDSPPTHAAEARPKAGRKRARPGEEEAPRLSSHLPANEECVYSSAIRRWID